MRPGGPGAGAERRRLRRAADGRSLGGRFRRFDARVSLDPDRPEAGSVAITIDTGSATLRVTEIAAALQKPEWLAFMTFGQASFESSRIRAIDLSRFEVAGRVSIKGIARKVVVPVGAVDRRQRHHRQPPIHHRPGDNGSPSATCANRPVAAAGVSGACPSPVSTTAPTSGRSACRSTPPQGPLRRASGT
ncbi:YceI family protein [Aquabacterium sp. J223]|uniref:YceI family protein n=1 Tax=Aquabacterium sp. J223 TaxID=2898431 RepID=UPI0039174CB6